MEYQKKEKRLQIVNNIGKGRTFHLFQTPSDLAHMSDLHSDLTPMSDLAPMSDLISDLTSRLTEDGAYGLRFKSYASSVLQSDVALNSIFTNFYLLEAVTLSGVGFVSDNPC